MALSVDFGNLSEQKKLFLSFLFAYSEQENNRKDNIKCKRHRFRLKLIHVFMTTASLLLIVLVVASVLFIFMLALLSCYRFSVNKNLLLFSLGYAYLCVISSDDFAHVCLV